MKVVYLAAGAAGMYCGSCMRDNRLAATLIEQGRDVSLIPLYTPLRTDERDVSDAHVHYGGINVYLQQKLPLFRHTPGLLDRFFDSKPLLNSVGRFAARTRPEDLGALTVSVLRGEDGPQRKELRRLIAFLQTLKPGLVNLPNLMFLGVARTLRRALKIPIVCTLSGEDIFLNALPEPFRAESFELIERAATEVDAFVSVTQYFADHAAGHFRLPRERISVIPMGIRVEEMAPGNDTVRPPDAPVVIAYLARVCPEKGLAVLADAYHELRRRGHNCVLRAAGYLGANDHSYLAQIRTALRNAGVEDGFEYVGEVSREEKFKLLAEADVLSVPTVYAEAKGFYILEALASGTPVVQPNHGSFPELVAATGGGVIYDPNDIKGLADALEQLMNDKALRKKLGVQGADSVRSRFTDEIMANETWALYERLIASVIP